MMMTAGKAGAGGFTLIELLVTLAVAVILATVAVPGFQRMMAVNRMAADHNEVISGLNYARSEAIKRRSNVTFEVVGDSPWAYEVVFDGDALRVRSGRDGRTELDDGFTVTFNSLGRPVGGCSAGCSVTLGSNMTGATDKIIAITSMGRVTRSP